ncbi:MAG TPA: 1-acyl-sn-glycerol-3-phosphate acyltransferase [Polyangiales bacterium]
MSRYHPDALDGRDPALIKRMLPLLEVFNAGYFRLTWDGAEHLPVTPAMFVGNHNGGIMGPDLFCTLSVLWRGLKPETPLFALAHDFAMRQLTPLGRVLQKVGAISASRANADRALTSGGHVLVYPGGDLDAYRNSRRRNEVVISPRTGFIEVAQANDVPIVPVVAAGAHRSAYIFWEGEWLARRLRMQTWARLERFSLALALPWGIAPGPWLPCLPLPFAVQLKILPPVHVSKREDVTRAGQRIQAMMQRALEGMLT